MKKIESLLETSHLPGLILVKDINTWIHTTDRQGYSDEVHNQGSMKTNSI
ncbi:MAG: hypothetical protein LLF83_10590 [Methanobacterium sp.]|nr:hypothetical protein [Methanobacterium sp.]